jgi:hypothetical protein
MSEVPEGMISLDEFARIKGLTPAKAIEMIRGGFYVGRKVGASWFVNASESSGPNSKTSKAKGSMVVSGNGTPHEVVVTDIQMSFLSMVVFMVKWVIASIPALIILFVIFSAIGVIFGGVITGLFGSR